MFSAMGELGEDLKRDGAPFICMNGLTVSVGVNWIFFSIARGTVSQRKRISGNLRFPLPKSFHLIKDIHQNEKDKLRESSEMERGMLGWAGMEWSGVE